MTDIDTTWDEVGDVYAVVERWMASTRGPRDAAELIELTDLVAPPPDSIGVDLGAYAGRWAAAIAGRHRCTMVPVDLAAVPLAGATGPSVNADMTRLPFPDASMALVWCRDALSCVDATTALAETARVLRPGAGAVFYTAVTTPRLEPLERSALLDALDAPAWWGEGRQPVDAAIAAAGLTVVHHERFSPEYEEDAMVTADADLLHDLAILGRLEREGAALDALLGPQWVAKVRAWSAWPLLLLLGKLETRAWVLRRP